MNLSPEFDASAATAEVGRAVAHDSAERHVCGSAPYIDDLREPSGTVHLAPGHADAARGKITGIDLSAVKAAPGVLAVLTVADIPGINDCSPAMGDDPILADGEVHFHGQVVFAVVAKTRDQAREILLRATLTGESTQVGAILGAEAWSQIVEASRSGKPVLRVAHRLLGK